MSLYERLRGSRVTGRQGSWRGISGRSVGVLAPLAVIALVACGAEAPERRLAEAREDLEETRDEVQELRARVEEKRGAVQLAEQALQRAREELEQAARNLDQVREKVDVRATDVALFRVVQSALLDSEELENVAIRAEVEDGVVTLHGEVDEPALAEEAVETARSAAGTEEISNQIRIRDGGSSGPGS